VSRPWLIVGAIVAAFLIAFVSAGAYAVVRYKLYYAPTDSMAPTVRTHQLFVADRFAYHNAAPQRNDVVVFVPPYVSDTVILKRVVAVPGDRFAIHAGRTTLNGKPIAEPYTLSANYDLAVRDYGLWVDGARVDGIGAGPVMPPRADWTAPDTVPRGCYIVLGDQRPNSLDSHAFGFLCPGQRVPNEPNIHPALVGRAILR
jgi:signal peptidase I